MKNKKEKTKNTDKNLKKIKETTIELLKLLGIEKPKIKLSQKEKAIRVDIDNVDSGILIGSHGQTISSIQLILNIIVYKKLGYWKRLVVNVGSYLEEREKKLEKIALNAAQKVKFSNKEIIISFLNSAERRIIHLILADNPDVVTESIGEGKERQLVVKPK